MNMLRKACSLWKAVRLRGEKGTTLYLRLFVFFSCFIFAIIMLFMLILMLSDVFNNGKRQSHIRMENELEHFAEDVSYDFGRLSIQGVRLSKQLSRGIEEYLKENKINEADLSGHPELLEELFSEQMPQLLSVLQNCQCSGVFLMLDATTNTQEKNVSKSGVFLKRTEPNVLNMMTPKFYYLRGPAKVARAYDVGLMGQWKMEFPLEECDFFTDSLKTARENPKLALSRLYYWSPRKMLMDNSEAGFLLCVPLISEDNTVYGICGMEVSAMLFKLLYSPDNSVYPHIFSVLAPASGDNFLMNEGLLAGNSYLNSSLMGEKTKIINMGKGFSAYQTENDAVYSGLHRTVSIYPSDSPYQNQQWLTGVMTPKEEMTTVIKSGNLKLQLGILGLLILSLLAAAFISKRYISPILHTLDRICNGEDCSSMPKTQFQEINDLLEFLSVQEEVDSALSAEEQCTSVQSDEIADSKVCELPPLDPERFNRFRERLKTLSPAERRVFDLYVKEYKAKDIAAELHLSINTIKYHNANIYSKLEVASRKELLSYIRATGIMQEKEGMNTDCE